jgi:DNA polymerase-4
MSQRKIIHVDMDAFFASVEQRDHPELRGKPVAVGGAGDRGVVAAASYEARAFGVFSAMPSRIALRKCPDLIFVPARFEVYKEASGQIRQIFLDYTDLVEPLSLDEAYLDVTENKLALPSATLIARQIKSRIKDTTGLTASAGVSVNKFLAKVASGLNKPDGLTVITPNEAEAFVETLPVGQFYGIGQVTAAKLNAMGIQTGQDLKRLSEAELYRQFGKNGRYFYQIARGHDDRLVQPNRVRKSLGAEETYHQDLETAEQMLAKIEQLAQEVAQSLSSLQIQGKTVTLKIKYHDFTLTTRSRTTLSALQAAPDLFKVGRDLLYKPFFPPQPVRLLGLSVSNLLRSGQGLPAPQLRLPF